MSSQRERDGHRSTDDRGDPDTVRAEGNTQRAMKPAIIVERLAKQFGEGADAVTAVDDISSTVEPRSTIGLLGPNDAGKTTTGHTTRRAISTTTPFRRQVTRQRGRRQPSRRG